MLSFTAQSLRSRRHGASRSHLKFMPASERPSRHGFTLVELLTVIAIIGILSAITFGVVKGVNERAAIGQAKAELATLAQALEAYKRQYGSYPLTTSNAEMLQALIGKSGFKKDSKTGDITMQAITNGRPLIDVTLLSCYDPSSSSPPKSAYESTSVTVQDPWGRDYVYAYSSTWVTGSYILLSAGPNGYTYGTSTKPPSLGSLVDNKGIFATDASTNSGSADNVYSNQ